MEESEWSYVMKHNYVYPVWDLDGLIDPYKAFT